MSKNAIFDYFVSLRQDIMDQISGIQNSPGFYSWDDTTPNWVNKPKLQELFYTHAMMAEALDVLIITRHLNCTNSSHNTIANGYPTSNIYGLSINYLSEDYMWEGEQLYQGKRCCICPCSNENKETDHYVIDDFVFRRDCLDIERCRKIVRVLQDIFQAIENCGDKRPRSAVREYLLRALLTTNDLILPETMENYIKQRR